MSGWLQPMLINIDEQLVFEGAGILWPDMRLVKAHEVEKLLGQAITTMRQRFRIRKRPMQGGDDPALALNVAGRSEVSRWRAHADPHRIPWLKFGRHAHLPNRATARW